MFDRALTIWDGAMRSPAINTTIADHFGWKLPPRMPRINNPAKMTGALTETTLGVPATRLLRLQRGSLGERLVRFSTNAVGSFWGGQRYPLAPQKHPSIS
jgi:hypothetical protein